jgi:transposase
MSTKRKEIVRLLGEGRSQNEITKALHCSKRDVSVIAKMIQETGMDGDTLAELSEEDIRQVVAPPKEHESNYIQPDFERLAKELSKRGVTRKLLWFEYTNTTVPEGGALYQYSYFCEELDKYLNASKATAKLRHKPGKVVFIDWAGDTMAIRDRVTGRDITVYLFVACLPYSGYFYVEGFVDTTQRSWIAGHIHAFEYFGGVPWVITPDNCATATDRTPSFITKVNTTYAEFVEFYSTAAIPTRVRRPRDKAMVEGAVGICERWIVAALRNQTFFSLEELNAVISTINERLNAEPYQVREGTRESVFFAEEKDGLKELPPQRYEMAEWKVAKVAPDYHVQVDYMRYSVDYHHIKQEVECRISDSCIDIFDKGRNLLASHVRLYGRKGQFHTLPEHMPPNHRHAESSYSPERFRRWAAGIGPSAVNVIENVMASRPIIEQTFVTCANILGLARKGRSELLEAACHRMLEIGGPVNWTRAKNTMAAIQASGGPYSVAANSQDAMTDTAQDIGRIRPSDYYRRERGDDYAD